MLARLLDSSSLQNHWWKPSLVYVLWVSLSFIASSLVVGFVSVALRDSGIWQNDDSTVSINAAVIAMGIAVYGLMLAIMIGLPRLFGRVRVTLKGLGVQRLPRWKDIGVTLLAVPVYVVLLVMATMLASYFSWINLDQAQDIGLNMVQPGAQLWLAFLLLVVIGPVAEELVFRGYLYGKLRATKAPVWICIVIASALFGAAHMQWNVAIDTFVLGAVMCVTREITGTIWPSIMMHMIKNSVAFYYLFIVAPGLGI